ncbi:hypothetical protein ES703_75667 [subsurface metagenome]
MSGEEAEKDFVGFARDLQGLRYTLRSALGLNPQRRLERLRSNVQVLSDRVRSQPQQEPERNPGGTGQGQRTATPLRGFGLLDRFLQPFQQQPGQEPGRNLTPEEAKAQQQVAEDYHRKELERLRKENLERVRGLSDLSISEDQ